MKCCITALLVNLFYCLTSPAFAQNIVEQNNSREKLLPEVVQLLFHPQAPHPELLKQDVYAALLAIDAPNGMDYMAIGAQTILCSFDNYKKAIATQGRAKLEPCQKTIDFYAGQPPLKMDMTINGQELFYPCQTLNDDHCIDRLLQQSEQYTALFQKNIELLERYTNIQQLPEHHSYLYGENFPLPFFHYQTRLNELRLTQAVIAFFEQDADSGFRLLTNEIAFAKRMLEQDSTLIGKMIAIARLFTSYHTLNALLDTPYMQPYLQDKRLLFLLARPNDREQKAMSKFKNELHFILSTTYLLSDDPSIEIARKKLKITGFSQVHRDRTTSTNLTYIFWQALIHKPSLSLDELSHLYARDQFYGFSPESFEQYELYASSYDDYFLRFYDYLVYRHLLHVKHQIISAGLKPHEVHAFLQSRGDEAKHPITKKPFLWDEAKGTLSTPWLANVPPPGGRGDISGAFPPMKMMSVDIFQ